MQPDREANRGVRSLATALGAALAARGVLRALTSVAGDDPRWRRRNYRGRDVSLLAGPALAAGAACGSLGFGRGPLGVRYAAMVAGGSAVVAGLADDLYGTAAARGVRGHLRALRGGEPTTGLVKVALIGVGGLVAGELCVAGPPGRRLAAAAVVAGAANVANLLDVRPGRAAKAALLVGVPLAVGSGPGRGVAAAVSGAAAALLPVELREATMLGDAGANTLGAVVGVAAVAGAPRWRIAAALVLVAALNAAAERVSFSAVIERNRLLRRVDEWGRRG